MRMRCVPWMLVAAAAMAETAPCPELPAKFARIHASWLSSATPRAEVERVFGVPARVVKNGFCTDLHYAYSGCSAAFTVCSEGSVISKTMSVGAVTVANSTPEPVTSDPAALKEAVLSLQSTMRELQSQISQMEGTIEKLKGQTDRTRSEAPDPAPAAPRAAKPEATPQCSATIQSGLRCSRQAAEASRFCWQHRNFGRSGRK
ncbi:MAG: hypothetical protein WD696_13835 [Bryobacteraceae bacterium]